jgi:GNAT superfamily N-acetyltransferase
VSPWAHGTVLRSSRHPNFYDFNLVRVEDDSSLGVASLEAFANEALVGLAHRRVDFDVIAAAEPLRAEFGAAGWTSMRLAWMRHEKPPARGAQAQVTVEEVPYDAVAELRLAWHREDSPAADARFLADARAVALRSDVRVLALLERERPVGFAQLRFAGDGAEITQVYVHRDHRGCGRGAAVTRAAITACRDVRDVWICADDEGRPKQLYARLGFRPVWTAMEYQRVLG